MLFDPIIASVRFGAGLSPRHALASDRKALLRDLSAPDDVATQHPVPVFADARPNATELAAAFQARFQAQGTEGFTLADAKVKALRQRIAAGQQSHAVATLARAVDTPIGFRERLVQFWADHFTVKARNAQSRHFVSPYIEEAIRPRIAGRFSDLLFAVVTHPMMLLYLQQAQSVGPNSVFGMRRGRGLNENLARELLELHTLGVDGGYLQADVTELAELLSGLGYAPERGVFFDPGRAEPGVETVLGRAYPAVGGLEVIADALESLALTPATARHLAQKMAAYFVADDPDPDLVNTIEAAYLDGAGDLMACYEVMLAHPGAWAPQPQKVRPPIDYMVATMRALGVRGHDLRELDKKTIRQLFERPLRVMGQPWHDPPGPDGWPDRAEDWIVPQFMAGRINWAMQAPKVFRDPLPDPREVVRQALGPDADPAVVFAAGAAEGRGEGLGLIFASAAFQRR